LQRFITLKNLEYDDTYGISGRLMVYGAEADGKHSFVQMINLEDLKLLCDHFLQQPSLLKEIVEENPKRHFDMTVQVYENLYGVEYIKLFANGVMSHMTKWSH